MSLAVAASRGWRGGSRFPKVKGVRVGCFPSRYYVECVRACMCVRERVKYKLFPFLARGTTYRVGLLRKPTGVLVIFGRQAVRYPWKVLVPSDVFCRYESVALASHRGGFMLNMLNYSILNASTPVGDVTCWLLE